MKTKQNCPLRCSHILKYLTWSVSHLVHPWDILYCIHDLVYVAIVIQVEMEISFGPEWNLENASMVQCQMSTNTDKLLAA